MLKQNDQVDDVSFILPDRSASIFWPTMFVIGLALTMVSAWLLMARIPLTIEARGMVISVGGVREIASATQGMVNNRSQFNSGIIRSGDVLMSVLVSELSVKHADLRDEYLGEQAVFDAERYVNLQDYKNKNLVITEKISSKKDNIKHLKASLDALELAFLAHEASTKITLASQKKQAGIVVDLYNGMEERSTELLNNKLSSIFDYTNFQTNRVSSLRSLSQINTEISNQNVVIIDNSQTLNELRDRIKGERITVLELEGSLENLINTYQLKNNDLNVRLLSSKNRLLESELFLWMKTNIYSPYDGNLISVKKAPGQQVVSGESVALLRLTSQQRNLFLIISPQSKHGILTFEYQGRRIEVPFQSDLVRLSEDLLTAYTQIIPNVTFIIRESGGNLIISTLQDNHEVLEQLKLVDSSIEDYFGVPVFAELIIIGDDWQEGKLKAVITLAPSDGKRVQVGDEVLIKPDFEKTLIGTQVKARVIGVSKYIATSIQAQAIVGSEEISQTLMGEGGRILAFVDFEFDADGELVLDGDALSRPLTSGSFTTNYITVDVESPIDILLPFYMDLIK